MNYQIFISYRHRATDAHARLIYEKLSEKGYKVFLDSENLSSGAYKSNIVNTVEECKDFIICLSENTLKRCDDENDIMKLEIETAIKFNKNIIPVFINGFKMPDKSQVNNEIEKIIENNGIECNMIYFDGFMEKLIAHLNSHPEDECLFESLELLKSKTMSLKHPYFKKWAIIKINDFLSQNKHFFENVNNTSPHSEETFGIKGIEYTKKNLKALTSVDDYWEDNFSIKYLDSQHKIIKKGIKVERIFVVNKYGYSEKYAQMKHQKKLGIDVYYIESDNEYIDSSWLKEDYIIQDDELLVEIFCDSHKFSSKIYTREHITMSPSEVKNKIERFDRILERAKKFEF